MKMQIDKIIKREVKSLIISLILILIMFIGVSYSTFLSVDESESSDSLSTGSLSFTFCRDVSCNSSISNYGQTIGLTNDGTTTSAAKVYPYATLTEVLNTTPYIFSVENTGSLNIYASLKLEEDSSFLPTGDYSTYTKTTQLYSNNIMVALSDCSSGTINKTNVIVKKYGSLTDSIVLNDELIGPEETKTYCMWTWLDENTPNSVMSTYFVANVKLIGNYYPDSYKNTVCSGNNAGECLSDYYDLLGLTPIVQASTGNQNYINTEYRFTGSNPGNYLGIKDSSGNITYTEYRVIGAFDSVYKETATDASTENRAYKLKVIGPSDSSAYFNSSVLSTNLSNWAGSTYFTSADSSSLNTTLNNTYLTSLTDISGFITEYTKYYLGTIDVSDYVSSIYADERSNTYPSGNKPYWYGKVGLLYASDVMYSSSSCYSSDSYAASSYSSCSSSTWMNYNYLTISPEVTDSSNNVAYINNYSISSGAISSTSSSYGLVAYLDYDVKYYGLKTYNGNTYIIIGA